MLHLSKKLSSRDVNREFSMATLCHLHISVWPMPANAWCNLDALSVLMLDVFCGTHQDVGRQRIRLRAN